MIIVNDIKRWLPYVGYVFSTIVSIIMAFRVEGILCRVLLVISTIVSLALAISRLITTKKMEKRIKYLEDHQISFEAHTESETFIVKEGNLNRQ